MHPLDSNMDFNPAQELPTERRTQTYMASYCGLSLSFGWGFLNIIDLPRHGCLKTALQLAVWTERYRCLKSSFQKPTLNLLLNFCGSHCQCIPFFIKTK